MIRRDAVLAVCLCLAAPAAAQTVNCQAPTTQVEMTSCAGLRFEAADADLNAAYRVAMDRARQADAAAPQVPSNAELLRDAQRAWIPFRDAACSAESTLVRGGSMQSQMFLECMERLTRVRTDDLRFFAGAFR